MLNILICNPYFLTSTLTQTLPPTDSNSLHPDQMGSGHLIWIYTAYKTKALSGFSRTMVDKVHCMLH